MAQTIMIDPVTRIEGHLAVEVEVDGGKVVNAKSMGMMFRGLELIMQGRDPRDAAQLMQRICGVCPISHATAGSLALDNAFGIEPPPNGRIIRNLIFGSNYIQSHILHFFHLAALDYVKGPDIPPFTPRYEGDYRFPADVNQQVVATYLKALQMRRKAQEMLALWGGKMPHQQAIVPGGVSEVPDSQKVAEFLFRLQELQAFIDNEYIPTVKAVAEVYPDYWDIGRGCMNFLVYGGFPLEEGMDHVSKKKLFPSKVYVNGQLSDLNIDVIDEAVKYCWYEDDTGGKKPTEAVVKPNTAKKGAYSFVKAPRYNGAPMEVGPLARMYVMGDETITQLGEKAFSVLGRHLARALECSMVAKEMATWVTQLEAGQPVCTPHKIPNSAQGVGLTEGPRGALGHWNRIEHQRTAVYNAIVPTTWNLSPRDDQDQMGPMEQALIGTPVADPNNPIEVVRVIRSFDPCLACAIHIMTPDKQTISQFQVG
jgi:hydrogenase large subunit